MPREPLRNGWQRLLHVLGVVAGWTLFVYWWYLVAVRDWDETDVALIIFVTLVASPAVTLGWVLHNLGVFRRKGPRMGQPPVEVEYAQDWNGRRVAADWARLRHAGVVAVRVDGDVKRYDAVPVPAAPAVTRAAAAGAVDATEPA
jgi:hypothetical protein